MGNSNGRTKRLRRPLHLKRDKRRQEAKERQAVRKGLTAAEQIAKLDVKLGVGIGATKERKRLSQVTIKSDASPKPVEVVQASKPNRTTKRLHNIRAKKKS